jgi:hypothetical protein
LGELAKIFKIFKILNERLAKQKTHFFHHWAKKYNSIGSNFLALSVSQMCEKKSCEELVQSQTKSSINFF